MPSSMALQLTRHASPGACAASGYERPVRVEVVPRRILGPLAKRRERADSLHPLAAPAAPEGQRRAPVALPGDRPVDVALKPLPEAAVAHVLRVPVDPGVELEHPVA